MSLIKLLFFGFFLSLYGNFSSSLYMRQATWKDEFNVDGSPNVEMWTRSVTKPGSQLSGYCDTDSNAYIKDGMLHLRVFKSGDPNVAYKAGRVIICKKYHFKKGRLVVRAKAPTSAGLWPAIWLNGPKTKKGYFAELDLMEHIHSMGESSYKAVYHIWGKFRGKEKNHVSYSKKVPVNVGEWHVYMLEVLDEKIIMSVDGKQVFKIFKGKFGEEWPENQEYSLRIAMAYGGYAAKKDGIDDSALPAEMLVDYVRFYKLRDNNHTICPN